MSNEVDSLDVVIIGGGLAGLTTAALLASSGKAVTLFEQSSKEIGGRARTTEIDGFYFNQGPHALCLSDDNSCGHLLLAMIKVKSPTSPINPHSTIPPHPTTLNC